MTPYPVIAWTPPAAPVRRPSIARAVVAAVAVVATAIALLAAASSSGLVATPPRPADMARIVEARPADDPCADGAYGTPVPGCPGLDDPIPPLEVTP
jgi:hypothetical protein